MKICKNCETHFKVGQCPACKKLYRIKTRAARSKYDKEWREKNKEYIKQRAATYNKENRIQESERQHKKYEANKPAIIKKSKEWKSRNMFRLGIYSANRRAKVKNVGGKLSTDLMIKLSALQKNKCACCHTDLTKVKVHKDHVMPISLGGVNEDWNIQLLCQICNSQKHSKHPVDFMQSRGFLL